MIRFQYQPHKVKTREILGVEGNLGAMIGLMAKFMVDEQGQPIEEGAAKEILLDLDLEDVVQAQNDFLPIIGQMSGNGKH